MRRTAIILAGLLFSGAVLAQDDDPVRQIPIEEVRVEAPRLLSDIGAQKTVLDTFALRENVTNSLADVFSQNTSIFIKSYGRATLSTASFRGTAPSHTQVTWNGMKLNSPMLGMVDFSLIPSYFIDDANLYHGASSVGLTGGGLGGAVALATRPEATEGFDARYIQGIGSFQTFDEFLQVSYGNRRWQGSTRAYYTSSENDFLYINIYKKEFIRDEAGNITGFVRPKERNRNGGFNDLHILQEFYYADPRGGRWDLSVWYLNSKRGVPMLNVDYREEDQSENTQHEQTLRATAGWQKLYDRSRLGVRAGYTYTDLFYLYRNLLAGDEYVDGVRSYSFVNTVYASVEGEHYWNDRWMLTASLTANQHFVRSQDKAVLSTDGNNRIVGYDQARAEVSAFASVRWKPTERLGFAVNLREEFYDDSFTPVIPAVFAEYTLSKQGNVILKASAARNYRYPTLNDLYFMPGGNDSLRSEKGFTYDGGIEFRIRKNRLDFSGEATLYDSYIKDWIVWLPTFKGFWTPKNVKEVHSYGLELKGKLTADLGRQWFLALHGNYAITRSVNRGDPANWADEAIGKQLVYIPEYSAAITGKLRWRAWAFTYKWNYYSERYTTSSNETQTKLGVLPSYYMSDISLERTVSTRWAEFSLKANMNNIFDEAYESVLSRPMAGRNYGLFLEIHPKW